MIHEWSALGELTMVEWENELGRWPIQLFDCRQTSVARVDHIVILPPRGQQKPDHHLSLLGIGEAAAPSTNIVG
jgi:hypothetical protein